MTIEKLINLKIAMKKGLLKKIVRQKFEEYRQSYEDMDKSIIDKINYRDTFMDYIRYMSKSGDKK